MSKTSAVPHRKLLRLAGWALLAQVLTVIILVVGGQVRLEAYNTIILVQALGLTALLFVDIGYVTLDAQEGTPETTAHALLLHLCSARSAEYIYITMGVIAISSFFYGVGGYLTGTVGIGALEHYMGVAIAIGVPQFVYFHFRSGAEAVPSDDGDGETPP